MFPAVFVGTLTPNKFYLKHTKKKESKKMTITVSNLNLYFNSEKMIKYGYRLNNNIITLNLPIKNSVDKIEVKIEIENIYNFEVKKMFVSNKKTYKRNLLQLSNKKNALNKGV